MLARIMYYFNFTMITNALFKVSQMFSIFLNLDIVAFKINILFI